MLDRLFTHCLLTSADISPSCETVHVIGVLNPGAVDERCGLAALKQKDVTASLK